MAQGLQIGSEVEHTQQLSGQELEQPLGRRVAARAMFINRSSDNIGGSVSIEFGRRVMGLGCLGMSGKALNWF